MKLNTVKNTVTVTLYSKRKLDITSANIKKQDINGTLQSISKKLYELKKEDESLKYKLFNLDRLFLVASRKNTIVSDLEKKLSILKEAHQNWINAKEMQSSLEKFGKNKSALKLKKELDSFVVKLELTKNKAVQVLNKIAKIQRPVQLTTKDNHFQSIVHYIIESFNGTDGKVPPTLDLKKSQNLIDFGSKGEIRFARYIPITNLPTVEGNKKNLYIVFVVTISVYKTKAGKLVPVSPKSVSNLSISMLATVVPPKKIPNLYQAPTLRKAQEILAFMSQKHNLLVLLGEPISSTPERRRLKVQEHLKIMKDKNILLKQDKSFFIVKVPVKDVPTLGTEPTNFEKELYTDMQRISGLPATSRYNTDRLRVNKREKKGKYWEFTYRVLPMRPNKDMIKEKDIVPKDDKDILNQESLDFLTTLRTDAKNWF